MSLAANADQLHSTGATIKLIVSSIYVDMNSYSPRPVHIDRFVQIGFGRRFNVKVIALT